MKIVYIIGPFRGSNPWQVECNVRRAEELALDVASHGMMPLCPHTNTRYFDGLLTASFWLSGTIELARRCDAAICVDGILSERSRIEVKDFESRGAPVFQKITDLHTWLRHEIDVGRG